MVSKVKTRLFAPDWYRYIGNLQKDFKLMIVCIVMLGAFRAFLLWRFTSHMSPSVDWRDFVGAALGGLRFDAAVSGYVAVISVVAGTFSGLLAIDSICARIRNTLAVGFIILSCLLFAVNFVFIMEFKDNFNQQVFGVFYDDFTAIVKSAWASYPMSLLTALALLCAAALSLLGLRFLRHPFVGRAYVQRRFNRWWSQALVSLVLMAVFVIVLRGSAGNRPVQMRDAGVTRDGFLNKLVLNPYYALKQSVVIHRQLSSSGRLEDFLPGRDVRSAARLLFHRPEPCADLDCYMRKRAQGLHSERPRHIFFIIMESLDSWALLEKYRSFDLLPNLRQLGRKGVLIKAFLPASRSTMTTLAAILTGLPDVGVATRFQPTAQKPYPTSIATQFKRLGYVTNFFYGGSLTWQRMFDFCKAQGFDHIYGGVHVGAGLMKNWGVDDNLLFDFIARTVTDGTPTFNMVLSTGYHPPFDVPVYERGFPYREMPDPVRDEYDGVVPLSVFGHLWYSDKVYGEFIRRTEARLPGSLFVVTGDHRSHVYLNPRCTEYERSSVPLLLYGNPFLRPLARPEGIAGSHLDIIPTLIELAAPAGFEYYTMGTDLLDPGRQQIGIGLERAVTPDYLIDLEGRSEPLPFESGGPPPDTAALTEVIREHYGVGWWRLLVGNQLPGPETAN